MLFNRFENTISYKPLTESSFVSRGETHKGEKIYVKLYGEFFSASQFYVHPVEDWERLVTLTNDMVAYYSDNTSDKIIRQPAIGAAVAIYDDQDESWLRAEVINILPNDIVQVQCVDYGTILETHYTKLFWLPTKFIAHHRLCLCVNLFKVPFISMFLEASI